MILILALSMLTALSTPAWGQQTAEEWLDEGNTLVIQGNYTEAIRCYDEATSLRPDHVHAWMNKAIALRALGRTSEAEEAYNRGQELLS